ncbi:hypothetical protein CNMCM7691_008338 [Aspergillus felis]|uniref:Glycosyl hydrolase family 43 protein n=1 Tax=Aspergillus felis TaxID=1287682 RepID=A0A8H6VA28_9EURO|nr:hypothetical protein CNMCM7691_008338 [Aspergillus felis]
MTGRLLSTFTTKKGQLTSSVYYLQPEDETPPKSRSSLFSRPLTRKKTIILGITGFLVIAIIVVVITVPIVVLRHKEPSSHQGPSDHQEPSDHASYHDESNRPIYAVYNFPDPGMIRVNGTWYSYATNAAINNPDVAHVPVATSQDLKNWTRLDGHDAMPTLAGWETGVNHWAPDVIQRNDGKFVLYYSGELKDWKRHHCIGAAVSEKEDPLGPYQPIPEPLACPREYGGAIDPSPFRDTDGKLYVTYKNDGNSIGHGGDCNNGKKPIVKVSIMLQELQDDGITPVGDPIEILRNEEEDGPLVEAPDIIRTDHGYYYLFYSSHCFTSPMYDVKYAYSTSLKGPYKRAPRALVKTGDFNLTSPGGATVAPDGTFMIFHANCAPKRCMYVTGIDIGADNLITISGLG